MKKPETAEMPVKRRSTPTAVMRRRTCAAIRFAGTLRRAILLAVLCAVSAALPAIDPPDLRLDYASDSAGRIWFYTRYEGIIPVSLWVDFPELSNLAGSIGFPHLFVIPPERSRQRALSETLPDRPAKGAGIPEDAVVLFYLDPVPGESTRFANQYRSNWGIPVDPADLSHTYLFPFAHGTKHRVTQGFNGTYTHFGENQYAVDFDLETGDEIYAARDGIVVGVREDSNIGGPSAAYADDANSILVYHEDGSFGNYVHLMQNGAVVETGDRVSAGQLIGYSGFTGQGSGPHLHFDVRIPAEDGRLVSIPIVFAGLDGEPVVPEAGRAYYAVHPGGPEFIAVFGEDITDSDYLEYAAPVPRTDSIEIRTELVDSTTLLFLQNGFDRTYSVDSTLGLENLTSTQGTRITSSIPPLTEVFLTILRPRDPESGWGHRIQLRYREVR